MGKTALSLILVGCMILLLCLGILLALYSLESGRAVVLQLEATKVASPTLCPTFTPAPTARFTATPSPTPTPTPSLPTPASARLRAEGPPTRIVIPAIGLDAKVVEVSWKTVQGKRGPMTVWETADYAAGFHKGSAYPGHGGNIVISGHHNVKGEVFRRLVDLEPGDEVLLYVGDVEYRYTVEKKMILREEGVSEEKRRENAKWIGPFPEERLTLVTCWPYTGISHRVIVVAKPSTFP